MKSNKFLVVCILIFVLLMSMAACGSSSSSTTDEASSAAVAQPATAENVIPEADPNATGDALVGNWQDVNTADRFANITKEGDKYKYVDNDGTYTGDFKIGILTLNVNENETANVFVDAKTGHLFMVYQGSPTEFKKK